MTDDIEHDVLLTDNWAPHVYNVIVLYCVRPKSLSRFTFQRHAKV